ncbi:MAG: type I-E CRISPR-associated protein Cse1/CasA [Gracilibacteraceae bacterium]|jgi:CRISPR system Cascade subunit CasA|nr:type I-E CRISPR-associated protein Cse1/CasA [Gracilibacteraceae bacterium]
MMTETKFNLLDEPWILVRHGAKVEEVTLKNVFRHAHEYHALAGELPTQDAAVLRVLLAVLYRTFTQADPDGEFVEIKDYNDALRRWKVLWSRGGFPAELVDQYLETYRDRFWLFHPSAPFFQAAGIKTSDGKTQPVTKMIAYVPSREENVFFTELRGDTAQSLTFAQAARWLVHLQAWDYAGKKNAVVGGTKDGGGAGWCGKLGVVYPVGAHLFETLMLNLMFANGSGELIAFGLPVWETEPKTAAKKDVTPRSYVELLTWQSRRARLFCEGDRVTGVISSYGDVFDKENMFLEQMSGWHDSSQRGQGYIPNTHSASRSMWRDLGALLPQANNEENKIRRPGVLDWLSSELKLSDTININAVGYEYGAMQGVVTEMISDSIALNAKLLAELGRDWAENIIGWLNDTEKAVGALGWLASDLDRAAGGAGTSSRERSKELAYFSLDEPFRKWLAGIAPDSSPVLETGNQWKTSAKHIIAGIGEELIADAGDAAFIGRELKDNKKTVYMTSAIAEMKFKGALRKIFGGETAK